jgi:hypothetical protein
MDWFCQLFAECSPGAALELQRMNTQVDITGILGSIKVPPYFYLEPMTMMFM